MRVLALKGEFEIEMERVGREGEGSGERKSERARALEGGGGKKKIGLWR